MQRSVEVGAFTKSSKVKWEESEGRFWQQINCMEYYKVLKLAREPFSSSPDPDFFYQALHHVECMQKTELAVRLRRGLNIVIGEVGTGKTTLCRQLIRRFSEDKKIAAHLLLDPHFSKPIEFLSTVDRMFGISNKGEKDITEWKLRENIKNYLFEQGVNKDKIIVLIIDEGQKIPDFCMELLREFLNYETNEYKLLQIIIFAQKEFKAKLKNHPGFTDRINLFYDLGPLSLRDTRLMIKYRLDKASETGKSVVKFSRPASRAIYEATEGYPRKVVKLCHQIILKLIIKSRSRAGYFLVRSYIRSLPRAKAKGFSWAKITGLIGLMIILIAFISVQLKIIPWDIHQLDKFLSTETEPRQSVEDKGIKDQGLRENQEKPQASATYPPILGKLAVTKERTIWGMIEDIYGYSDLEHLNKVKEANPQIKDFDNVESGGIITFPAIPGKLKARPGWNIWVQIAEGDELGEIYGLYRRYSRDFPHIRIIACWSRLAGLRFSIIIKRGFENEAAARSAIGKLPATLSATAKIISRWEDDAIFFSRGLMDKQTGN